MTVGETPASSSSSSGGGSSGSAFGKLKKGFKSVKKLAAEAVAAVEGEDVEDPQVPDASAGASAVVAKMEGNGLFAAMEKARKAVADKAREVAYDALPVAEGGSASAEGDLEEGKDYKDGWNWAKKVAARAKENIAEVSEAATKGIASASEMTSVSEWSETARKSMGNLSSQASSAGAALQEQRKVAAEKAKTLQKQGSARFQEANALAAKKAAEAKEKASVVGGAAKDRLSKAGESITSLRDMAVSPATMAQFAGIFLVGLMLIMLSFNFLPLIVIAPQKFALLFAFGSMIMLSSFAVLKGPKALAAQLMQREKLPFSVAYVVGLLGTLVATIILKNFILTAVFGVTQAIALLYFMASFVPGGQMALNGCGKCCKKVSGAAMNMLRK